MSNINNPVIINEMARIAEIETHIDYASMDVSIVKRSVNEFSSPDDIHYMYEIYKDVEQYICEMTESDLLTGIVDTMMGLYESYNKTLEHDCDYDYRSPNNVLDFLKGIPGIIIHDSMWGAKSNGYYTTYDSDNHMESDFVWIVFTRGEFAFKNDVDRYSDIYILYAPAIYSNSVGFGRYTCRRLTEDYSDFLEYMNRMTVTVGYRGHEYLSVNGYDFTEATVDDDSEEFDPDTVVERLYKWIDEQVASGHNVKVTSDSYGVTAMLNPQYINTDEI